MSAAETPNPISAQPGAEPTGPPPPRPPPPAPPGAAGGPAVQMMSREALEKQQREVAGTAAPPRAPRTPNEWSSAWIDIFQSCTICLVGWCCPCVLWGQLWEKIHKGKQKGCCCVITIGFLIAILLYQLLAQLNQRERDANDGDWTLLSMIYTALQMLIAVSFTYVTFKIRVKIRERDQIPGSEFEDCVLAWLCNCCITCQMARHEGFDDDAKYNLCSATGIPVDEDGNPV